MASNTYAADAKDEQPPWYEVEVIIFTNNEQLGLKSETWPEAVNDINYDKVIDLRLPDDPTVLAEKASLEEKARLEAAALASSRARPVTTGKPTKPGAPVAPPAPPTPPPEPPRPAEIPYLMLDQSTFQLQDVDQKLRRSGKYSVLLHLCWRQPTLPPGKSIPVYVYDGMTERHPATDGNAIPDQTSASTPAQNMPGMTMDRAASTTANEEMGPEYPRLSGTLRLSVSRYLHMQTDLHLRIPEMVQEEVPVTPPQDSESDGGGFSSFFGVKQPTEPQMVMQEHKEVTDFPLQESRRLRSTEIHYFDNPMFGMILTVRPYEPNQQQ